MDEINFGGNTHENRVKTAEFVADMVADEMPLERHDQFIEMVRRVRERLIAIQMDPQDDSLLALARDATRKVRDERLGPYLKTVPPPDCGKYGHVWYKGKCIYCDTPQGDDRD